MIGWSICGNSLGVDLWQKKVSYQLENEASMDANSKDVITIRQGSKESIKVTLTDLDARERLDLSAFNAGKAIFQTSAGETLEKALTLPGDDPKLGVLSFELTAAETETFDKCMKGFEIELTYTDGGDKELIILKNSIDIETRIA